MKTDLFSLCDFAADYNGKLSVIGVFDSLYTKQDSAAVRQCSVALRLRYDNKDEGKHTIKLSLSDGEGKTVVQLVETEIDLRASETAPTSILQLALSLGNLTLPRIGIYSVDLHVDSRQVSSTPLYLYKVTA